MNNHITIIGLGNPILKDDGIGHHVLDELEHHALPAGVRTVKAGGRLFEYWDALTHSTRIIVIDALQGGGPPGSIYVVRSEQITAEIPAVSADRSCFFQHEDDFMNALKLLNQQGIQPDVIIVGIEPKEIAFSLDLSPELHCKVAAVAKIVCGLCAETVARG